MQVNKYTDGHFKSDFYCNKRLNFNNPPKIKYAAADTETHLFLNGEQLTDDAAASVMETQGQQFCKENIRVTVWAYMIFFVHKEQQYFYVFDNIDDFIMFAALCRIKLIVWYNAKFDFSFFDWHCLTNGWTLADALIKNAEHYGHLPDKTYSSMQSDAGARYKFSLWKSYVNKNKNEKTHRINMQDLMNVLPGGLKSNLASWDVRDGVTGESIRKLTMDYVNDDISTNFDYLLNDTKGLYYLLEIFEREMYDLTGLSYIDGAFMTSGGIAKKLMLMRMYHTDSSKPALKLFQQDFPMSPEFDTELRAEHIYSGGKTLVNPYYRNKTVSGVYKLDVNSMYPAVMHDMLLPYGRAHIASEFVRKPGYVQVLHLKWLSGHVKPGFIGVWYDYEFKIYTEDIHEEWPFYIFADELEELEHWYDLVYEVDFCMEYRGVQNIGLRRLIDEFYEIKTNSKGAKKLCVKIVLNAMYGKMAERVEKVEGVYELTDGGYIHYKETGKNIDKKNIMNIIIGSEITSLARVNLMRRIRQVTDNNPRDNFLYCDTDSIHAFTRNTETDAKKLGELKIESPDGRAYDKALYLAPKSYVMIHDAFYAGDPEGLVVHCKGVNTGVVKSMLLKCKTIDEMRQIFKPNYPIRCLTAINAIGGKALIYKDKFILRESIGDVVDTYNGDGEIFSEV